MSRGQMRMGAVQEASPKLPAVIPGVVDGSVTVSVDDDGVITFHLMMGNGQDNGIACDHIEFIVGSEHAETLVRQLMKISTRSQSSLASSEAKSVPCCVGVSFRRQSGNRQR